MRTLPFFWSLILQPTDGDAVLQAGYCPRDVFSYFSLIRQSAEHGQFIFANQYTTTPHEPRYILLLHWFLGVVSGASGISPTWVYELSRIPLTFVFFFVLWGFLRPIFACRRTRLVACFLIGLSGGIEGFFKSLTHLLPEFLGNQYTENVWHLYGWNTFEALYNPLWIAGLTLTLMVLKPVVRPSGDQRASDYLVGPTFLLLYFVHPYSALVALGVIGAIPIGQFIFQQQVDWRKQARLALTLVPVLFVIGLIARWQAMDDVYRTTASHVFGKVSLAVFWYPLTLGAVGVMALRGAQRWTATAHPHRFMLLGWVAAVVFMHTSPIINGYHFTFHLHLPLCILAAPVVSDLLARLRAPASESPLARCYAWGALLLLFPSFLLVTAESIGDIERRNVVPRADLTVVDHLSRLPAGKVLAPPAIGNLIPAYTDHRVWTGHWFLTPEYLEKQQQFEHLTSDASQSDDLLALLEQEQIRYCVLPLTALPVVEDLRLLGWDREDVGDHACFTLFASP